MNKKILVFGILILFIISVSTTLVTGYKVKTSIISSKGKTLYVGGGGSGNYSTIQAAIDDAEDRDTVFVYEDSSPYYENNILISKSINLTGEDRETTIIDGGDEDILFIHGNNVSLCGFKIQNGRYGIRLESSSGTLISNNIFTNNRLDGILMSNSTYNTISENIFHYNDYGISLDWTLSAPGPCLYNNILNNTISNNSYRGIQISLYQRYNNIIGNTIENNKKEGVMICCSSNYNVVYHNNFKANGINGKDGYNNTWDNGYPSGGNFWDDYEGIDANGDGIGDKPYNITGGDNKDRYPLMKPWGENLPPNTPIINGSTNGQPGEEYDFSIVSTDPEGDDLYYLIDWGDGYEDVTGFSPSGIEIYISHGWSEPGTYTIRAKAVDINGAESDWGELIVTMPRNKVYSNIMLLRLLESYPMIKGLL